MKAHAEPDVILDSYSHGEETTFTIFALSAGFLLTKINFGKTGNQNPAQGGLWLPVFPILIF